MVDEPALEVNVTDTGYVDDAGFCPLNHHTVGFEPEIDGITGKVVEPTGIGFPPSGFGTVAVMVAMPADIPLTMTPVFCVNVPVGLTMAAGLVMESEMGVVLLEGVTVTFVVVVAPIATLGIPEKETVGTTVGPGGYPYDEQLPAVIATDELPVPTPTP